MFQQSRQASVTFGKNQWSGEAISQSPEDFDFGSRESPGMQDAERGKFRQKALRKWKWVIDI